MNESRTKWLKKKFNPKKKSEFRKIKKMWRDLTILDKERLINE